MKKLKDAVTQASIPALQDYGNVGKDKDDFTNLLKRAPELIKKLRKGTHNQEGN